MRFGALINNSNRHIFFSSVVSVYLDKVKTYPVDLAERRIAQFWEERDKEEGKRRETEREEVELEPEEQDPSVIPEIEDQIQLEPVRDGNTDIESNTTRRTSQSGKHLICFFL